MPRRLVFDFSESTARRVNSCAATAGIPSGLWLRVGVDAVRHLRAASALSGLEVSELGHVLDEHADHGGGSRSAAALAGRELYAYARALARGSTQASSMDTTIAVDVTDEIATSWALAAADANESLEAWVEAAVERVPPGAIGWEIAAANTGATLGEWIYAAALRWARTTASA